MAEHQTCLAISMGLLRKKNQSNCPYKDINAKEVSSAATAFLRKQCRVLSYSLQPAVLEAQVYTQEHRIDQPTFSIVRELIIHTCNGAMMEPSSTCKNNAADLDLNSDHPRV